MEEKEKELVSAVYSVEDLIYRAKMKAEILNIWGMLWWLMAVVLMIRCAPHVGLPSTLTTSVVGRCLSIQQPHRDKAEEQVAVFADGCGACPALLCKAGRCSRSIVLCARAAGPGHPSCESWWQVCRVWVSSCLSLALLPSGVSEHVMKSHLMCSCLLWHCWYFFTCSYLCVRPVQLSS